MLAGTLIFPMPVLVLCDSAFSQTHRWGAGIVITEDNDVTRKPIPGPLGERSFGGTLDEQGCPQCE
jgi:hypothetical protein